LNAPIKAFLEVSSGRRYDVKVQLIGPFSYGNNNEWNYNPSRRN
jgi:hypothetical protein